ncbi:NlpC/P60 family protein [Terrilactibacillus sp. BCM23-1]|uniref:NlpC/P60 family protein n=1 Tax=Terrilactibacillus tamarindi TaxID=2599694 RepID=A0A6N8CSC6_9BACI|nr:C40 family peptidase [Terrilactibacillus tamarindi]MTT32951.1 NlpC/P60 family protein [Terrilactibacillus tamarindi]
MNQITPFLTNVSVATVWKSPDSVRNVDGKAINYPCDIEGWLHDMSEEETIALCRENRLETQLLFGEEFLVEKMVDGWAYGYAVMQSSSKDPRGYPGYVPVNQLIKKPSSWDDQTNWLIVKEDRAPLYNQKGERVTILSMGTRLPIIKDLDENISVLVPSGEIGYLDRSSIAYDKLKPFSSQAIIKLAERFLNLPYLWAGMSSYGFDCSGFSYSMYRMFGKMIPRDAHDQAIKGEEVTFGEEKPGDLLFFAYEEGKGTIHHVGIYYGDGKMIHSPTPGKKIEITTLKGTIFERECCTIRRYLIESEANVS